MGPRSVLALAPVHLIRQTFGKISKGSNDSRRHADCLEICFLLIPRECQVSCSGRRRIGISLQRRRFRLVIKFFKKQGG